ncbi:MAG: DUF3987 domain-containing protein, partial [Gloeomargaritaceae cyanobacterium C42_A2020_066]|nr:DUF3987 domain-containing protein [Gloeomargaritaceae cyanobacterium C42_A2020_066]
MNTLSRATMAHNGHVAKFTPSGPRNPCPACGRVKDSDCRTTRYGLVFCHSYQAGRLGETITGSDGQTWAFVGHSDDGAGWGLWKLDQPLPSREWVKPPRPAGTRHFEYTDRQGLPLVRVCRRDDGLGDRKIWQERWQAGRWVKGLGDVAPHIPVYRVTEVREAIQAGRPVFMVEGEPTADLLWELGFAATTSIGGAGKWRKYGTGYLADLDGADLVLCPDRDKPGISHTEDIARDFPKARWLLAQPDHPQWQRPPEKGGYDIADWIDDLRREGLDDIVATMKSIRERILGAIQDGRPAVEAPPVDDDETDHDVRGELDRIVDYGRPADGLLPASLARPIAGLAGRMGLESELFHADLLGVAGSQIPIGTVVEIDRATKHYQPPILWVGTVGETGSMKSPKIRATIDPLDALQAEAEEDYQEKLRTYKSALRNDPDAEKPKPTEYYLSDYTIEYVSQVIGSQPNQGFTVYMDELSGFVGSFNQYRNGKGADRPRWLSAYDGRQWKYNRKSDDLRVHASHTSISIIGGIQPPVLKKIMEDDPNAEDGLWCRFAWVRMPLTVPPPPGEG